MGVEPVTYYRAVCDGCHADLTAASGSDFSAWSDAYTALDHAEEAMVGGEYCDRLLCDACQLSLQGAYADVEWLALTEPPTPEQGYMAWVAALGFLRAARPTEGGGQ